MWNVEQVSLELLTALFVDMLLSRGVYLFQYGLQGSAALPTPCVGHNAEGAHIVAAPHDGQVCADTACWPDRQNVGIGFFSAELHVHGTLMFAPARAGTTLQHASTGVYAK